MEVHLQSSLSILRPPRWVAEILQRKLTLKNPAFKKAERFAPVDPEVMGMRPKLKFYKRSRNKRTGDVRLILPRGSMPVDRWGKKLTLEGPKGKTITIDIGDIRDDRIAVPTEFPEFLLDSTAEQESIVRRVRSRKDGIGNFLVLLATGMGKTLGTALAAAELGQRTCVIVPTKLIEDTWKRDLKKGFGIDEEDIGIWKQQRFEVGEQFTIASLGTVRRRKKDLHEYFKHFGTVIFDEVQLVPATETRGIMSRCPCKYRIGTTATMRRKDGLHPLIEAIFGDPIMRKTSGSSETSIDVKRVIVRDAPLTEEEVPTPSYNEYLDAAINHQKRNAQIVRDVVRAYARGHYCLVATRRRDHVETLRAMCVERGAKEVFTLLGGAREEDVHQIVDEIREAPRAIVVATDQFIRIGANIQALDRLFLAVSLASKEDVIQLVGRIRRKDPEHPDKTAVVYDYVDWGIVWVANQYKKKRVPAYKKLGVPAYKNKIML